MARIYYERKKIKWKVKETMEIVRSEINKRAVKCEDVEKQKLHNDRTW